MPRDAEFTTLESYCKVMKPLVDITKAIGGERWVTISSVRPLLHKLLIMSAVHHLGIQSTMKENLSRRYTGSTLTTLGVAAFLDSRLPTGRGK